MGGDWREGGLEKSGGGQGEGQDSPHSAWPRLGMSTRSGDLGGIGGFYVAVWHFKVFVDVFIVLNICQVLWEQIK